MSAAKRGREELGSPRSPLRSRSPVRLKTADAPTSSPAQPAPDRKLASLRALLLPAGLDAYIVYSEDAHQSEYVPNHDLRRAWLTGFTGSWGIAVMTAEKALLWTDGRYFLQAGQQLGREWTLMRHLQKDVPTVEEWLISHLRRGQTVGVDPELTAYGAAKDLREKLEGAGLALKPVDGNLVDRIWEDQPPLPQTPTRVHPLKYAGRGVADKLKGVRESMRTEGAGVLVVSALDEVAWLLNIRGQDVQYNPVTLAYALVTEQQCRLYIQGTKITEAVRQHLAESHVTICPYETVREDLSSLVKALPAMQDGAFQSAGTKVWADPRQVSMALHQRIPKGQLLDKASPISLAKAVKNDAELEGLRQCHIRDGVALTAFLAWLEGVAGRGEAPKWTEYTVAQKLEEFRGQLEGHVSPSFGAIAGYGRNGAVIHYDPEAETALPLGTDNLFLLDSGGQYVDGTTDVTRTVHLGTPTDFQKRCFTLVLKGHIAIATTVFPEGTLGSKLDALARVPLWSAGLDYNHGTGHGVGAFLNVHEGPQGIHYRISQHEKGMQIGMTCSNEPGYYQDGEFGIRIETVCILREQKTDHNFSGKKYCRFETITMTPIQTKLIDVSLLTMQEIAWVNNYHAQVLATLTPFMRDNHAEGFAYLQRECQPIR